MADTALDFLLENMVQLINCNNELILKVYEDKLIRKDQIEWLYSELQCVRAFLYDTEEIRSEIQKVNDLVTRIRDVTCEVEDIIDSIIANAVMQNERSCMSEKHEDVTCLSIDQWSNDTKPLASVEVRVREYQLSKNKDVTWLRKFVHAFSRKKRNFMEGINSFMGQISCLACVSAKQMKNTTGELDSTKMKTVDAEETDGSDIVSPKKMMNVTGEHDSEKMKTVDAEETDGSDIVSPKKMMNVTAEHDSETMKTADAEETNGSDIVSPKKMMNVTGEHDSEKMKSVLEEADDSEKITDLMEEIKLKAAEKTQHDLESVVEEIKSIKIEVLQIYDKKMYGIDVPQIRKSSHGASSSRASNPIVKGEIIVGFGDDVTMIIELLTEEHEKQLKIIPIVGMPGLGKTTLAKKVYNDPFIEYHFYIRAWTYVSQVYQKRDLLLSILSSARIELTGNINLMNDEKLGEELYKRLKGNKYLIVIDDIWNIGAWDNLKIYFPNDNNGSRIMFTSRIVDVAVSLNAKPHYLRFLTEDESWELLEQKVFQKESCPAELLEMGKIIATKCQGLPLAIVVVSGLLAKKEKTQYWWRQVAEGLSSYIATDPKEYMNTLELSYNHLPHHLKPCFLYFGAFPEDYEIPVWQLMWLWVAEGFIQQHDEKSLEEVAEDYLMDLIDRSLVIASKRKSNGKIKVCRVHDLLRDLCLRKAQELIFLQQVLQYEQTSSSSSNPFAYKQRRMCIQDNIVDYTSLKGFEHHIRSFLSFSHSVYNLPVKHVSFVCQAFKLLRVINLLSIIYISFPKEIEKLVHLRYLALHVDHEHFQLSMSNLWNLETIMIAGPRGSLVLCDVTRMVKLRHVYTRRFIEIPDVPGDGSSFVLDNLQTIGKLDLSGGMCGLELFPNLKKLKCQDYGFPTLNFLIHLETLNLCHLDLHFPTTSQLHRRNPHMYAFPPNLKSLTLSYFRLPWEKMSFLGRLPNLEVLKLSYKAFEGPTWDTNDGEFRKLRFLKFQGVFIKRWNTCNDHFVNLQTLVLNDCQWLEEIPSSLGDIPTLEMIQVRWCKRSAEDSARQIQEEQKMMGNDGLKILIYSLNRD
ncbi:putative late blight resistance protein homolog R1A-3 [Cornus florida]|uniref:putative late blight resistance protein homolog R1A-3 n=1 Tax=Cornus florida TaxID=4283 RepID=UPI0028A26CD6|nr:putative late blight resistance protein homolog R1A-3 [Cornus florida]XP_059649644.1 putative late blight resistance protein homolog R1A-3 [Cornus florida]